KRRVDELTQSDQALQKARLDLDSLTGERERLNDELAQVRSALEAAGKQHRADASEWQTRARNLEAEQERLQEQLAHAQKESAENISELKSGVESSVRERVDLLQRIRELEEVQ